MLDGVWMERTEHKSPLLIEAQRVHVIVRRDKPQASAARLTRGLSDSFDQRRPDPSRRKDAVDRDDLAAVAAQAVGEQADDFAVVQREETRQCLPVVDYPMPDDNR